MNPTQIKTARKALGWTQKTLAEKANVHHKTVSYYERAGAATDTPAQGLQRITEAFAAAGVGKALTTPRGAMLAAFECMTPAQQVAAALTVCGQAQTNAQPDPQ